MVSPYQGFEKTLSQQGITGIPQKVLQGAADNSQAYTDQYLDAQAAMRALQHNQFMRDFNFRKMQSRHARKDERKDRQFGAFSALLGGAGGILGNYLGQPGLPDPGLYNQVEAGLARGPRIGGMAY